MTCPIARPVAFASTPFFLNSHQLCRSNLPLTTDAERVRQ
jgi:hypothetical protein